MCETAIGRPVERRRIGGTVEFAFGDCRLDVERRELRRRGEPVAVEPQVLDLLLHLIRNRDRVIGKDELITTVWGGRIVSDWSLFSRIHAARKAAGDDGKAQRVIRTIARKGVRFVAPVREQPQPAQPAPGRLSIVVLPFVDLSQVATGEHFADAVTDDLTTDLSRVLGGAVVARSTAFECNGQQADPRQIGRELGVRYVVEGSVRRIGAKVRVNARLMDVADGVYLWADRFDADRTRGNEVQGEIAGRLAHRLELELERLAACRFSCLDASAAGLVALGRVTFKSTNLTEARLPQARRLFEQALAVDPHFADAKLGMADVLVSTGAIYGPRAFGPEGEAWAEQLVREAMDHQPGGSLGHQVLGELRRLQNRLTESRIELETAIGLHPNNARALTQLSFTLACSGRIEAAMPFAKRALRLGPSQSDTRVAYAALGFCCLLGNRPRQAVEWLLRARAADWTVPYTHVYLAAALALDGHPDRARAALANAASFTPTGALSLARARRNIVGRPRFQALVENTMFCGLRRAGLPEE